MHRNAFRSLLLMALVCSAIQTLSDLPVSQTKLAEHSLHRESSTQCPTHPSALVFPEGIPGTEVTLFDQQLACFTDLADAFDVCMAQTLGPWSETFDFHLASSSISAQMFAASSL